MASIFDEEVSLYGINQLTTLTIDLFPHRDKVTNQDMSRLAIKHIRHFMSLKSLNIDLRGCEKISNKGVSALVDGGLSNLKCLRSLTLNFPLCAIGKGRVKSLACEGLQHLPQLTYLALKFEKCPYLTDKGVGSLASKELKYLTKLTSLTLGFSKCEGLTDAGIRILADEGLRNLIGLKSLDLKLKGSCNVTGEGGELFVIGNTEKSQAIDTIQSEIGTMWTGLLLWR